jgi:hypothetical protein
VSYDAEVRPRGYNSGDLVLTQSIWIDTDLAERLYLKGALYSKGTHYEIASGFDEDDIHYAQDLWSERKKTERERRIQEMLAD